MEVINEKWIAALTGGASPCWAPSFMRRVGQGIAAPGPGTDMWITAKQMQDIMDKMPLKDGKPGCLQHATVQRQHLRGCAFIRITESDGPHTHGD